MLPDLMLVFHNCLMHLMLELKLRLDRCYKLAGKLRTHLKSQKTEKHWILGLIEVFHMNLKLMKRSLFRILKQMM